MSASDRPEEPTSAGTPTGFSASGLDGQLCFALYIASRAMTNLYRLLLDDLRLTYPQYLVLLALEDGERRTVKELGRALQLDYGTLSPLLKRMEAGGLLVRRRRTDDERSVDIALTEVGSALRARAGTIAPHVAAATRLGETDLWELLETLHRVTGSVTAATDPRTH